MKRDKNIFDALKAKFSQVSFSAKTGEYIVRRGFFYRMGGSAEKLQSDVLAVVPQAVVTKSWERYGAWPTRSFWEVRFTISEVK